MIYRWNLAGALVHLRISAHNQRSLNRVPFTTEWSRFRISLHAPLPFAFREMDVDDSSVRESHFNECFAQLLNLVPHGCHSASNMPKQSAAHVAKTTRRPGTSSRQPLTRNRERYSCPARCGPAGTCAPARASGALLMQVPQILWRGKHKRIAACNRRVQSFRGAQITHRPHE